MKETAIDTEEDPVEPVFSSQPHYRFTRQPVKYHRHHNTAPRRSNPVAKLESVTSRSCPGSADSSRSSSPDPWTQRPSKMEKSSYSRPVIKGAESKLDAPVSPREVVEYMLGLDSGSKPDPSKNLRLSGERGHDMGHSTKSHLSMEHIVTSPAQKILSGLKLRRSHSSKDEQLFV